MLTWRLRRAAARRRAVIKDLLLLHRRRSHDLGAPAVWRGAAVPAGAAGTAGTTATRPRLWSLAHCPHSYVGVAPTTTIVPAGGGVSDLLWHPPPAVLPWSCKNFPRYVGRVFRIMEEGDGGLWHRIPHRRRSPDLGPAAVWRGAAVPAGAAGTAGTTATRLYPAALFSPKFPPGRWARVFEQVVGP